jgi:hypothetical protein
MKIEVKRYEGPWPESARILDPEEKVLLATGAIGAGPFTGVVEGLENVALGSLLGNMGTLVTIPPSRSGLPNAISNAIWRRLHSPSLQRTTSPTPSSKSLTRT